MAQEISTNYGHVTPAIADMVNNVIPSLHRTANNLHAANAGWKGDANKSFNAYHAKLNQAIQQVHNTLNDMADKLTQSHKNLGSTDSDNSQLFSQAESGLGSYTNL
jgi:WXG100 family type VII secretion target